MAVFNHEKERGRILASRIETANLTKKIAEDIAASPSGKARAEGRRLSAERAKLHSQLGGRLSEEARKIQEQNPRVDISTAYIMAGKRIGLHK
jgi:hypothetical protein